MKITSDISGSPAAPADTQKQAKLVDAAQQFEATMLQELLKPMRGEDDSWGGEEQNEDRASDTISSFGTEAVARAISKGGGFGIAKRVVSQVMTQSHQQAERKHSGTKV